MDSLAFRNFRTEINLLVFQTKRPFFPVSEMEINGMFPSEKRERLKYNMEGLDAPMIAKDKF